MHTEVKPLKIWFRSAAPLGEIVAALGSELGFDDFDLDAENVYEWAEAPRSDGAYTLNFSRQHAAESALERDLVTTLIMYGAVEPDDATVEKIARAIAAQLRLAVDIGEVEYLGGDAYAYRSQQRFGSDPARPQR